jgi:transposase
VVIEPTGHYWLNLAYFFEEKEIPLVMVNPMHVRRSKEIDDNLLIKHDAKDSLIIARLTKDGRFSYPRLLHDIEADLRIGSTFWEERASVQSQIIRWTERYFPELSAVLPFGKMVSTVLNTPFPDDIIG